MTAASAAAAAGKGKGEAARVSTSASALSASGAQASAGGHAYRLKRLVMGRWEMGTWYEAPYPPEFISIPTLYVCEYCLRYFRCGFSYERHCAKCVWRHPPGSEIYRRNQFSYWQVDGAQMKVCSSLLSALLRLSHSIIN